MQSIPAPLFHITKIFTLWPFCLLVKKGPADQKKMEKEGGRTSEIIIK